MGLRELAEDARRLGHDGIDVVRTDSGRRWRATCSCGWPAEISSGSNQLRTFATETEAILSAMRHIRQAVQAERKRATVNGVSVPQAVRPA